MTDISKLRELLARVESATGGDCKLEDDIAISLLGWRYHNFSDDHGEWRDEHDKYAMCPDAYTSSIDAAVALCERVLPGWGWSVCRCCVSDDARVWPDYNCAEHGERLKREFPLPAERYVDDRGAMTWGPYDEGFDIDRRPPGNVALALCEAILQAKLYIAEQAAA